MAAPVGPHADMYPGEVQELSPITLAMMGDPELLVVPAGTVAYCPLCAEPVESMTTYWSRPGVVVDRRRPAVGQVRSMAGIVLSPCGHGVSDILGAPPAPE